MLKDLVNSENHQEDLTQILNEEDTEYFYKLWEEDRL